MEQALQDLGLPATLVAEIEGRLRSQQKLLGKIVGVMSPPLFGCRTNTELCRVRGWDKNLPSRLLGALPKRSWLKRLRRLGVDVLVPLWRYAASKSEATRSRWQWTWVGDDSVFKKYGEQLSLVGTWWSGQEHRVLSGIDGVLLVVVIGDGKLVVPVDFAIRRPDPTGPGAPCRDKLYWVQVMLDGRIAALRRRGVHLSPPIVVADSWFGDSKLMRHVATTHQGTFLVEGKSIYVFELPDGRQVKGQDLQQHRDWPWRESKQVPGVRYARLRATSPTYGAVTLIVVDAAGEEQFYVMCARFLTEDCVIDPELRVATGLLYDQYRGWCDLADESPVSQRALATALKERGFMPGRSSRERFWEGLGLREEVYGFSG